MYNIQDRADVIQNKLWWLYKNQPKERVLMSYLIGYAFCLREAGAEFSELELFICHSFNGNSNEVCDKIKSLFVEDNYND